MAWHNRKPAPGSGLPTVLVRCPGPGKEHRFRSRDRVNERVCGRCREALRVLSLSMREVVTPSDSDHTKER